MINEEEYIKETGKSGFSNGLLTDAFKMWLERKDMEEGIRLVIEQEEKEWEKLIKMDIDAKRKAKQNEILRRKGIY